MTNPHDWPAPKCATCHDTTVLRTGRINKIIKVWIGCDACVWGNLYDVKLIQTNNSPGVTISSIEIQHDFHPLIPWDEDPPE